MTSGATPDIEPILAKATAADMPFWRRGEGDYDEHVQVKNARIHTCPQVIAPCKDAHAFAFWLRAVRGYKVPLTVRSGGHHHEGMCSNNLGIVLLASSACDIEIDTDNNTVTLGPGQALGDVIKALGHKDRILPTGGCVTVNVAGLTHGGGWGMSYRTWGLTSDALLAVEMVLPNGDIIEIGREGLIAGSTSLDVSPEELFWAIRGGGGGNFGIVTQFIFRIFAPDPAVYTEFTLQWDGEGRLGAAKKWADLCRDADERLNSFARMTVMNDATHKFYNPPFLVGGRFYGEEADCRAALKDFVEETKPRVEIYEQKDLKGPEGMLGALMLGSGGAPRLSDGTELPPQGYLLQPGAPTSDGPNDTCVPEALPHKISSGMPCGADAEIMKVAADYIEASEDLPDVNMYLSLHGMGGAGACMDPSEGAFPWRDKPYMLQIQAWWNKGAETNQQVFLDWVSGFREVLAPYCDGAFINFPDVDQPVEYYYGTSWEQLCKIKVKVDPDRVLGFPMGIWPQLHPAD